MSRSLQNAVFVLLTGLGWGLLGPASKLLYAAEPGTFDGLTVSIARAAWALPVFVFALAPAWRLSPPRLDRKRWAAVVDRELPYSCITECASGWKSVPRVPQWLPPQSPSRQPPTRNYYRQACDPRSWRFLPACFWTSNGRQLDDS